jgi:predicted small secreted protein
MKTHQLKTLVLLTVTAIAAVLLSGCNTISGERTAPDGSRLAIRSTRILWSSEGIKSSVQDANGLSFTLQVDKSNPDAQAIGAVSEGVARGLASSVTGRPSFSLPAIPTSPAPAPNPPAAISTPAVLLQPATPGASAVIPTFAPNATTTVPFLNATPPPSTSGQ